MDLVTLAALCALQAGAPPPASPWQALIAEAAIRFNVPEAWIAAVMRAESGGRPNEISPAGAIGLMQVMPTTYAAMRTRHGLGPDPAEPRDNILAGAAYLREMHDRFGCPGLFAAYNAGPGRVAAGGNLPAETENYLATLDRDTVSAGRREPANGSGNTVFVTLGQFGNHPVAAPLFAVWDGRPVSPRP
jgi:soluble lytic murein transglycosylase-like protein